MNPKTAVVDELLRRGLLQRSEIVDGDVVVADVTSRHQNSMVTAKNGRGYFVKRAVATQPMSMQTLMREAQCYALAVQDPSLAALTALMPKFHAWDAARQMLILDLIPGAENLASYYRRTRVFGEEPAAQMGRALGTYHSRAASTANSAWAGVLPRQQPWVLSFHLQTPATIMNLSGANAQMLEIVRRYPNFPIALEKLRTGWRPTALIHGDMKFENCVVSDTNGNGKPVLKVVDWEIADIGDPKWDAGSILQSFLTFWIFSMAATGADPMEYADKAQFPLEKMRPAMRAFWNTYAHTVGATGPNSRELLEVCASYGAARMLQTVFETMYTMPQLTSHAILLLQMSLNILQEPKAATAELFGL